MRGDVRKFGKRTYSASGTYHTKAEAEKEAKRLRKVGYFLVRVVKVRSKLGEYMGKGKSGYCLYTTNKK